MTKVELRPGESLDGLLRRFKKKVIKSGTLKSLKRKRWYVSPSEARRDAKKRAIRRARRRQYRQRRNE
ncbi:MAG: 30S ribosomal protein S21 [Anaerolineae bacterium]|nr:MAG: 30S ribosomal protein S21 [Anaerolineae bacterium]